ncbi:hypothetical protein [Streptacidiphilus sp. EB129]|uniref:hypothetical protein n=1 Tax=Streptacidiphilus sp. EB129 TaxID=3156262 RepID=UPI0035146F18
MTAVLMTAVVTAPAYAAPGDTTTTFIVSGGSLGITVPGTASLGSGTPGTSISGQLGAVQVTDNRALLTAAWTASVTSTSFKTGGGTAAETVPTTDVSYWSGAATATTGLGTFTPGQATAPAAQNLSVSRTAFTLTAGTGDDSATWNPTIVVTLPAAAVAGTYTGTVTHSVA